MNKKIEGGENRCQFKKTNNIIKLEKEIRLLHRRLRNIRNNHIHQATNKIVKTKPSRVVMETLNIKGMLKNKHLSKAISEQCLYDFKTKMQYKCKLYGIEFIEADKWYPSSKTCSCCGAIKKDLKLSDRVYKCNCGLVINRDLNASINLSRYKLA
ncbi:IS607 family transposase ISCbo6 [Clostridium haemolyticum]|nr:IS607 family transposase ISCbo6 [Clostridium haemolyticum]